MNIIESKPVIELTKAEVQLLIDFLHFVDNHENEYDDYARIQQIIDDLEYTQKKKLMDGNYFDIKIKED